MLSFDTVPAEVRSNSEQIALLHEKLDKLLKLSNNQNSQSERLTRQEIKSIYKVGFPKIHSLMREGKLKYTKAGRKTLFKIADVEAVFNQNI